MGKAIKLDTKYLEGFVSESDLNDIFPEVEKAHLLLQDKTGPGNDFLGWLDLPVQVGEEVLSDIQECADKLSENSDVIIIIGIGGSYLGAKALMEMLTPRFGTKKVIFAGYDISGEYLNELSDHIKDKDISVNVISKSGTTTEPAIAFRVISGFLSEKYSDEELKERIVCTTDKENGALKALADSKGYKTYVIPDNVGGRFSVLTPVGLLPAACAGINIKDLVLGAQKGYELSKDCSLETNLCYKYAAIRNILLRKGKTIEILSDFDYKFRFVAEWWKQLFGESEGKDGNGLFPASCGFTTDLHSMGQFIQDGSRNIIETFLIEEKEDEKCAVPFNEDNLDNLNYLAGKQISYVNKQAYLATREAHFEGGVPNLSIVLPEKNAFYLGQLFYFFEKAVAVSAYMLEVNPFNQPGVESYKKKMFKNLGKP